MRFEARVFQLAKDPLCPEDYQDSWHMDAERGVAAIADGVSSAIFSGPWARILTEAVVQHAPDPSQSAALTSWVAQQRAVWSATILRENLSWSQRAKLRQGAFSTLLWLQLAPLVPEPLQPSSATSGAYHLTGFAVGDSCLFHFRAGELLRSFPLVSAKEFETDPMVIGSLDLGHDANLALLRLDATCSVGDLLVLCTDAVAQWWLANHESGRDFDWQECWDCTPQAWQQSTLQLQAQREIRCDDCTVLLLRVQQPRPTQRPTRLPSCVASTESTRSVESPTEPVAQVAEPPAKPQDTAVQTPSASAQRLEQSGRELAATGLELVKRLGDFSEHLADHLSRQMGEGWKTFREAARKCQQKLAKSQGETPPGEPRPKEPDSP